MPTDKIKVRVTKIRELASDFVNEKLNEEYLPLIDKVIERLTKSQPSPLLRGKEKIWAAGILHLLGHTNYLYDPSSEPHITFEDLNAYFGTSASSVSNKAATMKHLFKIDRRFSFDFMTDTRKTNHPIFDTEQMDGFTVPMAVIPEAYQQIVKEALAERDKQSE